jgi:hypothetical protein
MRTNSDFIARMQRQLKNWDAEVAGLSADADKFTDASRQAYDERLRQLRVSREAAQKVFQQIRLASDSAARQMHAGMENAWTTMQKALEAASEELSK